MSPPVSDESFAMGGGDLQALASDLAALGQETRLRIVVLFKDGPMSPKRATSRLDGQKLGAVASVWRSAQSSA